MRFAPRTLFGRNLLLIVALVAIAQLGFALAFSYQVQRPRLERYLDYIGVQVNSLATALGQLEDPQRQAFIDAVNASGHSAVAIVADGEPDQPRNSERVLRYLIDRMRERHPDRRVGYTRDDERRLWIELDQHAGRTDWLVLRIGELLPDFPSVLIAGSLITALIAVTGAALIQRRITQPLRDLERAAGDVADGRHPQPVPDGGSDELAIVARSFNRMAANLQRVEQERAVMLAGISHDLRTPLTKLWLGLEMLGPDTDPALMRNMTGSIEAADRIIDQFIDYARGLDAEAIVEADLDALVARIASSAGDVRLTTGGLTRFGFRPIAIERAVTNLVENARRHASEVELRTRSEPDFAIVEVLDRGPGIPADRLDEVRQPFRRLDDSRGSSVAGAGLGLAIVDRIAALHAGRFDLENRPGGGLVARLTLPINAPGRESRFPMH
ncbi:two-component system sensor histidine kinase EnvZ [soil metagenome]